jgi:hypothetical protein
MKRGRQFRIANCEFDEQRGHGETGRKFRIANCEHDQQREPENRRTGETEPRGRSDDSLVSKNPAHRDIRNLDLTPLDLFGTMGPTDRTPKRRKSGGRSDGAASR